MVQRKVPSSKLGIQGDHVKSEKRSTNQDGKSRGSAMKKKMNKSRSINLSDLDALPSSSSSSSSSPSPPSRRCLLQQGKPPPLHVPTMVGSPNYMKPTSSSHAKKELYPVSIRNTQPGSNFKNLTSKKSGMSSLSLVRSLSKTTSFKASSRACPRKSARAALRAPERATCASTLKGSKFPAYLMLNPGGTSAMKVCPYKYCSLNGHRHAALAPLKSFLSARRRLLKTQKSFMRLNAPSPRRVLEYPCDAEKDSEVEQKVLDVDATYDEVTCMDIFIEIYAKERESKPTGADQLGKFDFFKEIEDDGVKQVAPRIMDAPSTRASEIDLEQDHEKSSDQASTGIETKGIFLHGQCSEEADERNYTRWSHEEISMGSYCSDDSYDGDNKKDDEMEWEGQQRLCEFGRQEDVGSSVSSEEDSDSNESSRDVSVTWLDDIVSSYYEDFLAEETFQEFYSEERKFFEEQGSGFVLEGTSGSSEIEEIASPSNYLDSDQSFSTEVSFEYPEKAADDDDKENEKLLDHEPSCDKKVLDEETIDNNQCQKMCETCCVGQTSKERCSSIENRDESSNKENQVHMFDVPEASAMADKEQGLLEKCPGKAKKFENTRCIISDDEEQNARKNWNGSIKCLRPVEDEDEMRRFIPRGPNFLTLVPEPEPEKVDLRHQMMDERKDANEWMIDCALRQVVTKLAPARKKKVALLVEAFETVMPIPKCETLIRNHSAFPQARHIQACS